MIGKGTTLILGDQKEKVRIIAKVSQPASMRSIPRVVVETMNGKRAFTMNAARLIGRTFALV
jgi:hypothetical protein